MYIRSWIKEMNDSRAPHVTAIIAKPMGCIAKYSDFYIGFSGAIGTICEVHMTEAEAMEFVKQIQLGIKNSEFKSPAAIEYVTK